MTGVCRFVGGRWNLPNATSLPEECKSGSICSSISARFRREPGDRQELAEGKRTMSDGGLRGGDDSKRCFFRWRSAMLLLMLAKRDAHGRHRPHGATNSITS
jgi:hypothetical protein